MSLLRLFSLLSLAAGLNACEAGTRVVDAHWSALTALDCRSERLLDGDKVCREKLKPKADLRPVYCYRTLGQIDCYRDKDPYMTAREGRITLKPVGEAKPPHID